MKISIVLLLVISIIRVNTGCKKETTTNGGLSPSNTNPTIPSVSQNTPPIAHTSGDLIVDFQVNGTFMGGSCSDAENNIKGFSWTKISGPDRFTLENKDALGTKISGMEKGIYKFELTVTDSMGLYDKDTMMVIVGELSANPTDIIFKDISWEHGGLLWGTVAEVKNIYTYLPGGSIFKVYLQTTKLPDWTEIAQYDNQGNSIYAFFLKNGHLHVYSDHDESGVANLKIVY